MTVTEQLFWKWQVNVYVKVGRVESIHNLELKIINEPA